MGALEYLQVSSSHSIVPPSDVAPLAVRSSDITSVTTVVHYDVTRDVDTFIHRAGRTSVSGLTIRADLLVTFFGSVGRNQLKFSASMPDHLTALVP